MEARLSLDCIIALWEQCDARTASSLLIAIPALARALWAELASQNITIAIKGHIRLESRVDLYLHVELKKNCYIILTPSWNELIFSADKVLYNVNDERGMDVIATYVNLEIKGPLSSRYLGALNRVLIDCCRCGCSSYWTRYCNSCGTAERYCPDCLSECGLCHRDSCIDCINIECNVYHIS